MPQHRAPDAEIVFMVEVLLPVVHALHEAVVVYVVAGDLDAEIIRRRHINAAPRRDPVEASPPRLYEAAELLGGFLQYDAHRAAGRVSAEQGALGSPQHLHPVDVEQGVVVGVLTLHEKIIHISAYGRIESGDGFRVVQAPQRIGVRRA